eukprot:gnl/MRDRNA2_/MRDRNA2_30526_c0_seq1.p1 gnl/MRDRNA2_/MRDRNA2_30526_c0~~gnl/MRDRNA2_/MRDRNA2_30526_c0_seq1.p1  ORF type:complete len:423 (+),score=66.38 gnl/MRDRNA2_/MRDRNA2_30526_c0_seq1:109-1377(+)
MALGWMAWFHSFFFAAGPLVMTSWMPGLVLLFITSWPTVCSKKFDHKPGRIKPFGTSWTEPAHFSLSIDPVGEDHEEVSQEPFHDGHLSNFGGVGLLADSRGFAVTVSSHVEEHKSDDSKKDQGLLADDEEYLTRSTYNYQSKRTDSFFSGNLSQNKLNDSSTENCDGADEKQVEGGDSIISVGLSLGRHNDSVTEKGMLLQEKEAVGMASLTSVKATESTEEQLPRQVDWGRCNRVDDNAIIKRAAVYCFAIQKVVMLFTVYHCVALVWFNTETVELELYGVNNSAFVSCSYLGYPTDEKDLLEKVWQHSDLEKRRQDTEASQQNPKKEADNNCLAGWQDRGYDKDKSKCLKPTMSGLKEWVEKYLVKFPKYGGSTSKSNCQKFAVGLYNSVTHSTQKEKQRRAAKISAPFEGLSRRSSSM